MHSDHRLLPVWTTVARQDAAMDRRFARIMHRKPTHRKPPAVTVWLLPSPLPAERDWRKAFYRRADTHYLGTNERHLARFPA